MTYSSEGLEQVISANLAAAFGIAVDQTTWSQILETAESVGLLRERCEELVSA